MRSLKSKAYDVDEVSPVMFHIDVYLTHVIDSAIEVIYFPQMWKKSIGYPLAEKGMCEFLSDLRQISIIPSASLVIEMIIYQQIFEFVSSNNILPYCQSRLGSIFILKLLYA